MPLPRPFPLDDADKLASLAQVGEDAVVAAVLQTYARAGATSGANVLVVAGDDAAVLVPDGPVVVSVDTLAERVDFRRDWSAAADVGAKAVAQGLADVVAMGATPQAVLISVATSGAETVAWLLDLAAGVASEATRARVVVAGGDLSEAEQVVVTVTALGTLRGRAPVRRRGARPGDVVALAGEVGPSAAGLALLRSGHGHSPGGLDLDPPLCALVAAHRRPTPPYLAGVAASQAGATAMIDVSDGLVRDARRLAVTSGVVIQVGLDAERSLLELLSPAALGPMGRAGRLLSTDPERWSLTGGEDHALLATFPPDASLPAEFRPIGRVAAGSADVFVRGEPWTASPGWTAFSGR